MIKVKICGLRRPQDIAFANELRPDYIGFVFAKSSRRVDAESARALRAMLSPDISAVGVFVNAPAEEIASLYRDGIIDLAQLHGDETETEIRTLKALCPDLSVIKAVRVRTPGQITAAASLPCDFLLLDTWQKDAYGGSGRRFDKRLIPPLQKPYFLAGGLSAENVREELSSLAGRMPFAVDVSSAVETDGYKDREKMLQFIERVQNYE